jgi:hypothetical protein
MIVIANSKLAIIHAVKDGVGVSKAELDGIAMMLVHSGDCVLDPSLPKLDGKPIIANNNSSS